MEHQIVSAVFNNRIDELRARLEENPVLLRTYRPRVNSLLRLTCDVEMTTLLLENGISVNHQNRNGETILHGFAAYYNHDEILSLYLRHGANPHLKDEDGHTAESYCTHISWIDQEAAHKRWIWIQSVPVLVTLVAISERKRKTGGRTVLQTELFRYLQSFLTDPL